MLSRVANSLYWTGRYIERSENLARYLRVQYFSTLDTPMMSSRDFVLKSILNMYGIAYEEGVPSVEQEVLYEVTLNREVPYSLLSNVYAARENARSIRNTLSSELWEIINEYYLFMNEYDREYLLTRGLYDYTYKANRFCTIIRSYVHHTLLHDDVWAFINLGIHLERALQIARILSSKLHDMSVLSENGENIPLLNYQGTITLKVLEAFDVHRRIYRKIPSRRTVSEFLFSNMAFPRSIAHNVNHINELIQQIDKSHGNGNEITFRAGKIAGYFQYLEYDDIADNLDNVLNDSLLKISKLHEMIDKKYLHI